MVSALIDISLALTGDGPVYDSPILQLDRDRLIVELHQESNGTSITRCRISWGGKQDTSKRET